MQVTSALRTVRAPWRSFARPDSRPVWGRRTLAWAVAILVLGVFGGAGSLYAAPAIGDPAPDFAFEGKNGQIHLLSEHRGKRGVVIAWFPKAFTPG